MTQDAMGVCPPQEKTLAYSEPMQSAEIGELAEALAAAQASMSDPGKTKTAQVRTRTGPGYSFDYATLADGLAECRKALPAHGLSIIQQVTCPNGKIRLRTMLMHKSGQWIASEYPINPGDGTSQSLGSAITYARRYALFALVGIAPEDDDGNAASGNEATISQKVQVKRTEKAA